MAILFRAVLVAVMLSGPALAQSSGGASEGASGQSGDIRTVISSQLQAFAEDDFARAFTFASPNIKSMFGTPERFGKMVQGGYPMVWRPARVDFGGLETINGRLVQTVYFLDQAGRSFEASYEMIDTGDGWQINGVAIREADLGA